MFDPPLKQVLPELGKVRSASNEKANAGRAWTPRSNEESVVATAESLVGSGFLKGRRGRPSIAQRRTRAHYLCGGAHGLHAGLIFG